MAAELSATDKSFTVFVPTDKAFGKLQAWQFDEIFDNKELVKRVI